MTADQLKKLLNNPPPMASKWAEVSNAITPHLKGEMPNAITQAFPNETKEQLQYRKNVHRSETTDMLWQAIDDVKATAMGDRFRIEYSDRMAAIIGDKTFAGWPLSYYFWDVVYPLRVGDPNGMLAVIPITSEDPTNRLDFELKPFKSNAILHVSEQAVILEDESQKFRWVFTPNDVSKWFLDDRIEVVYVHNFNDFGVYLLGGRIKTDIGKDSRMHTYYDSDFAKVVPIMDKIEVLDNQLTSCTNTNVFPIRIVREVNCTVCKGTGQVDKRDANGQLCFIEKDSPLGHKIKTVEKCDCTACKGKGTISLGALDQIVVPKKVVSSTEQAEANIALNDYLSYVAPSTEASKELREQLADKTAKLAKSLNLAQASDQAQSGVSKRYDREGKYSQLHSIALGMERLINSTLRMIAKYLFFNESERETELSQILVSAPASYEIMTESEAEEAYSENLSEKPIGMRIKQYMHLISIRYKHNPEHIALERMAIKLTNGDYLRSIDELSTLNATGVISSQDMRRAIKIMPALMSIAADADISTLDQAALIARIDSQIGAPPPPSIPFA